MPTSTSTAKPKWSGLIIRAALPVLVLSAGLLSLSLLLRNEPAQALPTLGWRTLGGILVSAAVIATLVLMNGRGAQRRIVMPGRTRDALGTMLLGILLWLLPAVVMLAIPAFGGPITIPAQPTDAALIWLLLLTAVFFGEALPEELVFRGHVQTVLLEKLGQWPAIIIQALVFALFGMALGGWRGWLDLSLLLTMGLVFGYLRMRFKSIWFGIGFHTAFQFGAQAILTHGLLETAASPQLVQVAIGAVPFTVAVMAGVWRKSA